ncbi:MAG: hypothetical protein KJ072_14935 [Verrucomicrobia bacterium]|nr:hypothetical protein [Verrucomicrobiota bacterium]
MQNDGPGQAIRTKLGQESLEISRRGDPFPNLAESSGSEFRPAVVRRVNLKHGIGVSPDFDDPLFQDLELQQVTAA